MKPWVLGPEWAGVDKKHDNRAGKYALDDTGARRDRARLESIWAPSDVATHVGGVGRGIFAHRKENDTLVLLEAVGLHLFADGTQVTKPDATEFTLGAGLLPIRFTRYGYRTFIIDGQGGPWYWDERDPTHAYPMVLPAAPGTLTSSVTVLPEVTIDTFTYSSAGELSPLYTTAGTAAGWYYLNGARYKPNKTSSPLGGVTLHMDTEMCEVGDSFYRVVSPALDWREITGITIDLFSGGNEKVSGTFMALILGDDPLHPENAYEIPLPIAAASTKCHVTIRLDSLAPAIPASLRDSVAFYGFRVKEKFEHVVWMKNLETTAGVTGDLEYKAVDVAVQGTGAYQVQLPGLESETVAAAAGSQGATVTLASGTSLPSGWVRKWYRRIKDVTTEFRYVGTQTSGQANYVDSAASVDIVTNPALKRSRAQTPTGAHEVFAFNNRLLLVKGSDLWASAKGDWTTWIDVIPEEVPDLVEEFALTDADACRIPLSEVGRVLAIAPLGVETGSDFVQDAALMSADWTARLVGDGPLTFNLGYRRPGGVAGPSAWSNDADGNLWKIDRDGDVTRIGRDWSERVMSEPIEEVLRPLAGSSDWTLACDPQTRRIALFAGANEAWTFDTMKGGWDRLAAASYGTVVAAAVTGGGDRAYGIVQASDNTVRRLFDLTAARATGTWTSRELTALGYEMRAVQAYLDGKDATLTVKMDGTTIGTLTVTGEDEKWVNLPIGVKGRAFSVALSWTGTGFVRTVRVDFAPWGKGVK